ncbi:MAG: hypothetical protein IPL19_17260 [Sandaracinaceae bacterium]|nr:hypothetical protein [Sandaracinaceae bacterium]MBK8409717.1 hypothetical protein [Sandaracinaceae bacterium]
MVTIVIQVVTMPIHAITIPIYLVTMPIQVVTMPILAVTMRRSRWSRCADPGGHDGASRAAAERDLPRLDEKLFLEVFATPTPARAGGRKR